MSVAPAACDARASDKFTANSRCIIADSISNLSDAELIDVANQAFTAMDSALGNYPGVTQQQVDDLKSFKNLFTTDLTDHVSKQAAAKSATQAKEASRATVEAQLRILRNIAKAAGASAAAMAALGIPISSGTAPSNATFPAGSVNTSQRLRHTIEWTDASALDNKRKPRGVMGCEIWVKLDGAPPTDEKECTFLTLDAFTPYLAEYEGADAGKMAHYLIRWRMKDGSVSAWGETISATITG